MAKSSTIWKLQYECNLYTLNMYATMRIEAFHQYKKPLVRSLIYFINIAHFIMLHNKESAKEPFTIQGNADPPSFEEP